MVRSGVIPRHCALNFSTLPKGSGVKHAALGPISLHFPERVETNDQLRAEYPHWDIDLIAEKTGVVRRHIAAPGECSSDLGVAACERLFAEHRVERESIDFLLLCTQTPDYPLPTTACLMQERLRLPTRVGALDFNLGCSGFVYGLALAEGLITSGAARRILLVTAETYSKLIHAEDRSLRTIFGDAAAATLVEAADAPSLGGFVFGTDGRGADALLVAEGGARPPEQAIRPRKRRRWKSPLFMDGPALVDITLETIPGLIDQVLTAGGADRAQIELYLMHQATQFMLERLRQRLNLDEAQLPLIMRNVGNTVSSTIPIVIHELRQQGRLRQGTRSMLVGYGVGFSWAGCLWTETWKDAKPRVSASDEQATSHRNGASHPLSAAPTPQ
jgi:3-oxoacyl-[acyl-carrier-protein] synthase III